ncbi:CdvA-like protein [Candidatus Bathyarchaeota archaeon]|nr:CdvA-like protein [Candidatus Bathyarchaeota archaeon]
MISWKHSFDKINEEFEIVKKKKQALDSLLSSGRISQSTYDLFNKEIENAIAEIERQQTALLERMNSKVEELKQQIKTLEILLANFEIQHVMGEINEEEYRREVDLLSAGLENARQELAAIQEAVNQLSSAVETEAETVQPEAEQPSEEAAVQPEIEVSEEETSVIESEEISEETVQEVPQEPSVEVAEVESIQNQQEQEQEQPQEVPSETPSQSVEEQQEQQMEEVEAEEEKNEE